jgi:hypothetical protein
VAPLTGNIDSRPWVPVDLAVQGVQMPSGLPPHFCYKLPAQYDSNKLYPILIWLHPTFEANGWYSRDPNVGPTDMCFADAENYYGGTDFRTRYPCIVVVGYADQTPGDDATWNWGGWTNDGSTATGSHANGESGPNVFSYVGVGNNGGIVQWVVDNLSGDPSRVYVEGFSLGGIGAEYWLLRYNQVNGIKKVFTAGHSTGGTMELYGFGAGPSNADVSAMTNVPVWWVSGGQDGTSRPQDWNDPSWRALAGNSNYPAPGSSEAASRAGNSKFHYWRDPNIGHQPTDSAGNPYATYRAILDFLFAQIGNV